MDKKSKALTQSKQVKAVPAKIPSLPKGSIPFPIVGIGSSAGGLAALEQFLRHVPVDCGLAFVIVQHLDPNHKGLMPELLQRVTKMPVHQVKDRMRVEPNSVYQIPPNKDMSILNGVLHLFDPVQARGLRLPIDFFLRSLALDHQELSIGIVLSGMGSDGTLGLRAIKEKAGLVAVQEPASAQFDSMPRSAIDAGLADIVAPAEELPDKILAYLKYVPFITNETAVLEERHKSALEKVIILLRAKTGQDFSLYKKNTMYRRIERRMGIHQIDRIATYVRFLQENPQEIELLFREQLIGVTSFFRDPEEWARLIGEALPAMLATRPKGGTLRAWSAGCSTGEEAYSLAIAFKEALAKLKPKVSYSLQIFATDLDQDAIGRARLGVYPLSISSDISPERLQQFFILEEKGYRIGREIREMVTFATQNLIMDPPFTKLDILICRNLLIYLMPELQKRLIPLFHYSLNHGGCLFLGSAETISAFGDLFIPLHARSRLFRRTGTLLRTEPLAFPATFTPALPGLPQEVTMPKSAVNLQTLADRLLLADYSPAAVLTNNQGDVLYINGRTGKYLEPAAGKANWNIFAMTREELRFELTGAFQKAVRENQTLCVKGCKVGTNGGTQNVDIKIQPLEKPAALGGMVLVVFQEVSVPKLVKSHKKYKPGSEEHQRVVDLEEELDHSRAELLALREGMQGSQEELKSMNEELQSTNEELQSTNEELTTSKEELQSMNEELQTVNAEQTSKMEELGRVNNDMKNLLNSTEIITLFLDNQLQVQRFTAGANKLFKLLPGDIGRPLTDITSSLHYPALAEDALEVLRTLATVEKQVAAGDGHWFMVRIMPYRTLENMINGVVLTFTNISSAKQQEQQLKEASMMLRALVQSASFVIICLSDEGTILEFNPEAERLLGRKRAEVIGQNYFETFVPQLSSGERATAIAAMLKVNPKENYQTEVSAASGTQLIVEWSSRKLLDKTGQTIGVVAIGQELS